MDTKILTTIVGLIMGILTLIKDNYIKKWTFNSLIIACMVFMTTCTIIDIIIENSNKYKVSFHYEAYQNRDNINPGLYIDNKGTERFFIDSVIIIYKDKSINIFNDSSWLYAIKALETNALIKDLEKPYFLCVNKHRGVFPGESVPFITCALSNCHHSIPDDFELAIGGRVTAYCHDKKGKKFNSDTQ